MSEAALIILGIKLFFTLIQPQNLALIGQDGAAVKVLLKDMLARKLWTQDELNALGEPTLKLIAAELSAALDSGLLLPTLAAKPAAVGTPVA